MAIGFAAIKEKGEPFRRVKAPLEAKVYEAVSGPGQLDVTAKLYFEGKPDPLEVQRAILDENGCAGKGNIAADSSDCDLPDRSILVTNMKGGYYDIKITGK